MLIKGSHYGPAIGSKNGLVAILVLMFLILILLALILLLALFGFEFGRSIGLCAACFLLSGTFSLIFIGDVPPLEKLISLQLN